MKRFVWIACLLISSTLLLAGCAGERYHRQGLNLLAEGKAEAGLAELERAVKEAPDNRQFQADLSSRRADQVNRLLSAASVERTAAKLDAAAALYQRVLQIDAANLRATEGLTALTRDRRNLGLLEQARASIKKNDLDQAVKLVSNVLTDNPNDAAGLALKRQLDELQLIERNSEPTLQTSQKKPISLEFRDANLKTVIEALARSTGINFILDKDVRPDLRTTIYLRQAALEDAIELILQTNRLEKKVLNQNTILIYPNTPDKLKEYQELMVKGFYLANADVKQTQTMLKGLLKAKDIFIDEKLNLLVMRDTPEAVRLAAKLIAMHDLYEPEVMLEVEVLEIQRSRLLELGIQFPNQLTLTPLPAGANAVLSDLRNLNSDRIGTTLPSATLNLRRDVGDVNILANPRIRARNREKAKIMIGDKVPVVTTTTTATGFTAESVQYLDVGIKLDVEPNVYLQDEVAIKVGLEVSSIVREIRTPSGSLAYQIGSRAASTVLRLKDGETQVLAGLISDDDRSSASRIPGLGDIPVVGRLFSSQKDERQKTEIVLSITPHLIRNINRPELAASEFWSGTELSLKTKALSIQKSNLADAAAATAPAGEVPSASIDSIDAAAANAPTAVSLSWNAPGALKAGQEFKVALKLKSDGGLRSLPFQVGFDPAAIQVLNIAEGPYFKRNGANSSLSSNVDPATGKIFVSLVRADANGASGDAEVVIFTLKALQAGQSTALTLLSATPIAVGDKTITPSLPAPLPLIVDK